MDNKTNIPKIRFPGYTDFWEQRKLDDLCSLVTKQTGFDYSSTIKPALMNEHIEGTIPFIQNKDFSGNEINMDTDFYIPEDIVEKYPKITLDQPCLLISISGKIGNVGLYKRSERAFIGGAVCICRLLEDTNGEFIMQELLSDKGQKYFQSLIKASSHQNITVEDIRKIDISMPSSSEQEKIGEFFSNLDNLIILHQRKIDAIKEYKKGVLQKMLPRDGASVPEIRFSGFNDSWEQRKCEGILKPAKGAMKIGPFGSALKKEFYTETGVKVYAQENIFQEDFTIGDYYISEERYQTLKGCKLEPGDLVISMMGTIGACAIFPENAEPGIMNSHLLRLQLNDDIYPEYIHQLLRDAQIIRSQIDRLSVGSIMSGLSSAVVQKLVFPIPSIDEQKTIAEFLLHFDKAITLYQSKLDAMKEYKKGLLQQMFV